MLLPADERVQSTVQYPVQRRLVLRRGHCGHGRVDGPQKRRVLRESRAGRAAQRSVHHRGRVGLAVGSLFDAHVRPAVLTRFRRHYG